MTTEDLVATARRAASGSYSPFSRYRVGAAVVTEDGSVYSSANVENSSYPVSQCAEANAVNYAISQGHRRITDVAVACLDAEDLDGAYPCGRCRQILNEFGVERVMVATAEGDYRVHTFGELLPYAFTLDPDEREPTQ